MSNPVSDLTLDNLTVTDTIETKDLHVLETTYTKNLQVNENAVLNTINANGNVTADTHVITPAQLGCVSGVTSNIQTQLDGKANIASPVFTGNVDLPSTKCQGLFNAEAGITTTTLTASGNITADTHVITPAQLGCVSGVTSNIQTQLDGKANIASPAFTGNVELPNVRVTGPLDAEAGITTTTTLTASGNSVLHGTTATTLTTSGAVTMNGAVSTYGGLTVHGSPADLHSFTSSNASSVTGGLTADNMTVTGNLKVNGTITGNMQNMEVVQYYMSGASDTTTEIMQLHHNSTNTTSYIVIPTIYYGFSGNSNTYDAMNSGMALANAIVITNRTTTTFTFTVDKNNGKNINVYVSFLVLYGVQGTNYPTSY
jgi:cytoskeletal protein CcmA (bactofilin family)